MAFRKAAFPFCTSVFNLVSPWRFHVSAVQLGWITNIVPKARVCVNIRPDQQYSRQQVWTEEELCERAKFLALHFHGSEVVMLNFLSNNIQLVSMGREKFDRVSVLLADHGITIKELLTYSNVYRRKYETIAGRIRQLEKSGIKPVTLRMINTTLKKYQTKYGRLILDMEALEMYKSGPDLLSLELGFTEAEAENVIKESMWLSNTKLSTLKEKIELLWSYGVSSEAIRDRVWVLAFPVVTIRSRLDAMKQSGLLFKDFPKNYLTAIKSSEDKFRKFQQRLLEDKDILDGIGCSDKLDFICSRLSCSREDLDIMCKKFPALLSIRLPKLKTNLDLLLREFGVAPSLIIESPRVLRLSTETLRERIEQLNKAGIPVTGSALNLSAQQFDRIVARLSSIV